MKHKAVIGLGFGDEGKGLVTNYLCLQNPSSSVVRYSGGQQAGHTVYKNNIQHTFSNFGSGSLNGNSTYWSQYCTIDPIGILNELDVLNTKGIQPTLYIDPKCPVTTPFEKTFLGDSIKHGTCGVGVGQTFQREKDHYSLLFEDLFFPFIYKNKLKLMGDNYYCNSIDFTKFYTEIEELIIEIGKNSLLNSSFIFEGSQGLLLDQNIGFFPHVTRSNTGTKNILEMVDDPEYYLVTRAYQTRHGNGPMSNENIPITLINNENEINKLNYFQGEFRVSVLDLDLLLYGIQKDENLNPSECNLVITCLDQLTEYKLTYKGELKTFTSESNFIKYISNVLNIDSIYLSHSPHSENIIKFS